MLQQINEEKSKSNHNSENYDQIQPLYNHNFSDTNHLEIDLQMDLEDGKVETVDEIKHNYVDPQIIESKESEDKIQNEDDIEYTKVAENEIESENKEEQENLEQNQLKEQTDIKTHIRKKSTYNEGKYYTGIIPEDNEECEEELNYNTVSKNENFLSPGK